MDYRGLLIEKSFYGLNNEPVIAKDDVGVSKTTVQYDEYNNPIENSYFGIDGLPMLNKNGISKQATTYDIHNNITKLSYFGVDGKPSLNMSGIASASVERDKNGNVLELLYFGVDGQPKLNSYNVAKLNFKYDNHGNNVEVASYGINYEPVLTRNPADGAHKTIFKYDDRDNLTEILFYGIDEMPMLSEVSGVAKLKIKFDVRGKKIEVSSYGVNNKLIVNKLGYAKSINKYNSSTGVLNSVHFIGADNNPSNNIYGINKLSINEKTAQLTFYNLDGDSFSDNNASLTTAMVQLPSEKLGFYRGDTISKSSFEFSYKIKVLEGQSAFLSNKKETWLATISFFAKGTDKFFLLKEYNTHCNIKDKVENVKILLNSKEYLFYKLCWKKNDKENMVVYAVPSLERLKYSAILTEVFEKESIEISYGGKLLHFLTKGSIKEYVKTMMRH